MGFKLETRIDMLEMQCRLLDKAVNDIKKQRDELQALLPTILAMITDYLDLANFYRSQSAVSEIKTMQKQIREALNGKRANPRTTASSNSD